MHFFPLQRGRAGNESGVLCVNHENIDQVFIHPNGFSRGADGSRPVEDEVRKEIASHGVGIVEIAKNRRGEWKVQKSKLNRRITAETPMDITGPARGSNLLRTRYSPKGTRTRGTVNNCANGFTPWGTYLTCEENWAGYFYNTATAGRPREHSRYGVPASAASTYGWGTRPEDRYARFNATPTTAEFYDATAAANDYRNEPNTFGWVVEIDPFDPRSTPKKRTALGRLGHEGAWFAPVQIGKPIVIYTGDDSRGEYMYKYVSRKPYSPWEACGDDLLDDGTLYVARFNEDGTGQWVALTFGKNGLTRANGFASQADILVNTRSAADYVLATKLDRPEWAVVDERSGHVYLTLTNNTSRGSSSQPVDPANPRAGNQDGHIIRWREDRGRYWATEFTWDIFAFGGPSLATVQSLGAAAPYNANPAYAAQVFPGTDQQAYLDDDATFNSPDGLWIDSHTGLVWIQTDGYSNTARGFGNQQMLAANPDSGVVKRFLVGPKGSELTGITATPDRRTLFVNTQHPDGQWPNIDGETRPRSATLVITKDDGGVIGT
jgi:secreted PhoX family phosphatase